MLGLVTLVLGGVAAGAAAPQAVMTIRADVVESCLITAEPMAFGTLAPGARGTAEARLTLACTPGTPFAVTLDAGAHGADGQRRMADASGTRFLAYDLYHDAPGTRAWSAENPHRGAAPREGAITLAAFGRIAEQEAIAGTYADMVTVTVAF